MPSDKSLETLAREWLDEHCECGYCDLQIEPLVALLRSRDERAVRIVKEVLTFPCQCDEAYVGRGLKDPNCQSCQAAEDRDEIKRRLEAEDA